MSLSRRTGLVLTKALLTLLIFINNIRKERYRSSGGVDPPGLGFKQSALTLCGLTACSHEQTFTQHAIVPSYLSAKGKLLPYSPCLSETALRSKKKCASLGAPYESFALPLS